MPPQLRWVHLIGVVGLNASTPRPHHLNGEPFGGRRTSPHPRGSDRRSGLYPARRWGTPLGNSRDPASGADLGLRAGCRTSGSVRLLWCVRPSRQPNTLQEVGEQETRSRGEEQEERRGVTGCVEEWRKRQGKPTKRTQRQQPQASTRCRKERRGLG